MEYLKQRINTDAPLVAGSNYHRAFLVSKGTQAKNEPLGAVSELRVYEALSCNLACSYEALKGAPMEPPMDGNTLFRKVSVDSS